MTVEEREHESVEYLPPGSYGFYGTETRFLLISGEINEEIANAFMSQLYHLNSISHDPIKIHLNTPGGDLLQAFAMYDAMGVVAAPIIIITTGACMSCGLILLLGGDQRYATQHTRFFYHEPMVESSTISSKASEDHHEFYTWCLDSMQMIFHRRSKVKSRLWKKYFANQISYSFDADKALEFGLIDDLLMPTKKGHGRG